MRYLVPQGRGVYFGLGLGIVGVDGELLGIGASLGCGTHEVVVDLDRYVCARNLAGFHLGVNKFLGIGMLDGHCHHQCAAASVLGHLACGVGVALHERHETGGGQRRVLDRRALGADVRQVVAHTAATLHELHLLLVDQDDAAIGIGVTVQADHEAVGQRAHLQVIAYAGHGRTLRHNVAEAVEQFEHLLVAHGVGIFCLDAGYLAGDAVVHVGRGEFVDIMPGVLQGIFADPYAGRKFVTVEIGKRSLVGLAIRVCGFFCLHL